jgi:2-oxoglutarate ferredoxin oxidoreductase subunit gamma
MEDGLNAVQSQAYGPEARGGASKSEVVLARGEIDYPKAANPNLQVILTQKACDEYAHDTASGGTIILDDFFVRQDPDVDAKIYRLPIVKTAREVLGREIVTNMVALGTVARVLELLDMVKPESIRNTILANVPPGTEELNSRAFDEGYKLMKEKK